MKLSERSQILLDRYLLAVERRLPLQGRKDMVAEIQANLLDKMEDTFAPEEVLTESQLEAELRKFGSPGSVAASYHSTDVLIAPQFNEPFLFVLRIIVPIVVAAVFLAGLISFVVGGGESPFLSFFGLLDSMFKVAVNIVGITAIALILITRFFPRAAESIKMDFMKEDRDEWKVNDLPEPVDSSDRLQIWEPIVGIIVNSFLLVILLFLFDQLVGIWWYDNNAWHVMPIFTEAFKAFIPMFAIKIGAEIVLNGIQLYQHRHSLLSRWFEVVIKGFEIMIVGLMLNAGTLLSFDQTMALEQGLPIEGAQGLALVFQNDYLRWFLIFLLVVLGIDLIKKMVQAVRKTAAGNK
jgi:hypothetical protein